MCDRWLARRSCGGNSPAIKRSWKAVKNFALIAEGAAEVKALVKGQHWFVLQTPEYREFSTEMQLAAERLEQAAQHQSIDGVTLRYFDLTLNCVDCHTYIEKQKY